MKYIIFCYIGCAHYISMVCLHTQGVCVCVTGDTVREEDKADTTLVTDSALLFCGERGR